MYPPPSEDDAIDPLTGKPYAWMNNPSSSNGLPQPTYMPSSSPSGMMSDVGSSAAEGFAAGGPIGAAAAAGGSFLTNLFGMKNANDQAQKNRQQQLDMQSNSLAANNAANTAAIAEAEAARDPFKSRMTQVGDVAKLDRVQNARTTPRTVAPTAAYAGSMPAVSGGYSYQKSPDVTNAAGAAKQSIMSGTPDPSMTNPANYGKTGALDLIGIANGSKDPTSPNAMATGAPAAASTLGADPVANMIRQGYMQKLGRSPSDGEIQSVIGQLSKIYGRQLTAADSGLINGWIQKDLAASPEAQAYKPSYAGQ
jgi:hypothetical protein